MQLLQRQDRHDGRRGLERAGEVGEGSESDELAEELTPRERDEVAHHSKMQARQLHP